jgi:uncharacterized cupin superfamily protein
MDRSAAEDRPTGPFDLSRTPIHLGSQPGAANPAVPLSGFGFDVPAFERYIAEHCASGAPGRLIMVETTPSRWERHPEGDEIVIVLEGKGVFVQEIGGQERRTAVGPYSTIINPAGVWHTADVEEPVKAVYITPCPGTQHRPR